MENHKTKTNQKKTSGCNKYKKEIQVVVIQSYIEGN